MALDRTAPHRRRLLLAALTVLAAGAVMLTGCGGGPDRTKANLRVVNASGYSSLDVYVADVLRFAAIDTATGSSYQEIDPDETGSRIVRAGATSTLVSLTPALVRKKFYSLVAWGREGQLQSVLLDDNEAAADSGKAKLRVLNASSDAGLLDVFLTADGDALADAVALSAGAKVGEVGAFATVSAASNWRLRVTAAGARTDLRLDLRGLSLPSGSVQTLVLTPTAGGVLVNGQLLVQQGAMTSRPVEHARVRVAASLPQGEAVSVAIDAQTLMSQVASPAVGAYVWVPAGARNVAITAGAAALPSTLVSLAPGAEYTLLVHAATGTPAASWIGEDNRRPVSTSMARLRLVNGVASSTAALSLTADALPLVSGVLPGTGSAAVDLLAATLPLSVLSAGSVDPLYTHEHTLAAGELYTVFELGGPAPLTVVRKDR